LSKSASKLDQQNLQNKSDNHNEQKEPVVEEASKNIVVFVTQFP
jgi:hypothetical protein